MQTGGGRSGNGGIGICAHHPLFDGPAANQPVDLDRLGLSDVVGPLHRLEVNLRGHRRPHELRQRGQWAKIEKDAGDEKSRRQYTHGSRSTQQSYHQQH